MRAGTIFDQLREAVAKNGAWKTPSPQSELDVQLGHGQLATTIVQDGIGQCWTTSRSSRTFTGGGITPQQYTTAQPENVDDRLRDAGVVMNARAALPNRGVTPRSPLMRRG